MFFSFAPPLFLNIDAPGGRKKKDNIVFFALREGEVVALIFFKNTRGTRHKNLSCWWNTHKNDHPPPSPLASDKQNRKSEKKRLAVWFFCCCVFFSFSRSETRSVVRWLTIFQVNRVLRAITISHTVPHLIQQQNNRCKGSNGCRGEYALQVFFSLCRSAWWIRTLIAFYTLGGWDAFRTNNNNKTVLHFVVKFYLIFSFFFIRPRSMDFFSTASHNLIRKSFIFFFLLRHESRCFISPSSFFLLLFSSLAARRRIHSYVCIYIRARPFSFPGGGVFS